MATTTNYGWDKPTNLGDVGAWGTKLNTLFDDADADVKAVEVKADKALAENLSLPLQLPLGFANAQANSDSFTILGAASNGLTCGRTTSGADSGTWIIPIYGLKTGTRITGFTVRYNGNGGTITTTAALIKRAAGTWNATTLGTTADMNDSNVGGATQSASVGSLTDDVSDGNAYYIQIVFSRGSGTGATVIFGVEVDVIRL